MASLRDTAARWLADGTPAVLVEVTEALGSAPREAGTRMLVSATQCDGTIGGGHLELKAIERARRVFVIGLGGDGIPARAFAMRLSLVGVLCVHHFDTVLMTAATSTADAKDVLIVFSEHGRQASLCHIARQFRERGGKVVSVTRHTPNPLRAHADAALLVSAHDERPHVQPLLYHSALTHLLDLIFVLLCEEGRGRLAQLDSNAERVQDMLDT